MKSASSIGLAVTLLLGGAGARENKVYPNRWVRVNSALRQDADVEKVRAIVETAAAHGLNGMVLSAGLDQIDLKPPDYFERLERVFAAIGEKARGKKCEGIAGLIDEGKEWMEEDAEPDVLDAGIIGAAQKVEHYEIATYGCLCTWAKQLDLFDAADLLGQNLDQEKAADSKLTEIAESHINAQAATGG